MIKLAAFFGNPGAKYAHNRHNAGRLLAQFLPFYRTLSWKKKYLGLFTGKNDMNFLMPETYMNLSGESVFAAAAFLKIKTEEIIVIHDELELPLGTISLKFSGGLGGHNGLRSMKKCFDTADFWRLRIGIGRPDSRPPGGGGTEGSGEGIVDWVLSDFTEPELDFLAPALETGSELLLQTFACEPETLLPQWAKKKVEIPIQESPDNSLEESEHD